MLNGGEPRARPESTVYQSNYVRSDSHLREARGQEPVRVGPDVVGLVAWRLDLRQVTPTREAGPPMLKAEPNEARAHDGRHGRHGDAESEKVPLGSASGADGGGETGDAGLAAPQSHPVGRGVQTLREELVSFVFLRQLLLQDT